MAEMAVAPRRLEGVPDGVAEIEQSPLPPLPLIGGDNAGFNGTAGFDDRLAKFGIGEAGQSLEIEGEQGEEGAIADQCVFDHFTQSGEAVTDLEGGEQCRIDADQFGLMKGADEVLAEGVIDPGLAADAAVDLGEQSRGNLDKTDAAQKGRSDESGEIADHATSEGEDDRRAVETTRDKLAPERLALCQ